MSKIVKLSQLKMNGFSNVDLENHRKLIVKKEELADGSYFSQEEWRYLKYNFVEDAIIKIDDISVNRKEGSSGGYIYFQTARIGSNPKHSIIKDSVVNVGYDLKAVPIAVNRKVNDDGVYYEIIDGRTRLQILKNLGVSNVIVDIFEISSDEEVLIFASQANNSDLVSGKATVADMINSINSLLEMNSSLTKLPIKIENINSDPNHMASRRARVAEVLEKAVETLTLGAMPPSEVSQVVNTVIEGRQKSPLVVSFRRGKGYAVYLREVLNIDIRCEDYNHYFVTSVGSEGKMGYIKQAINDRLNEDPSKPVNIILYCGDPSHRNPEKKWLEATQEFIVKLRQFLEDDGQNCYFGTQFDWSKVVIMGAIPQCRSLERYFPMNKLVRIADFDNSPWRIGRTKIEQSKYERSRGYSEAAG